jgi:hypothetical protein
MQKMRSERNTASRKSCVTRITVKALHGMKVADPAPQLLARERVERREWFIQHQQLGLVNERPTQAGALLHTAGQLPRIFVALPAESDPCQEAVGPGDVLRLASADSGAMRLDDFERQQKIFEVVRQGSRVGFWKAMPASLTGADTWLPATRILPSRGNCSPVASFIRVDLPQPDGPTTAANSPSSTETLSPCTAGARSGAPA